jgi:hypothetical protein
MPRVGFEPTIPVFERAKTVHALDCAATVIGYTVTFTCIKENSAMTLQITHSTYMMIPPDTETVYVIICSLRHYATN